VPAVRSTFRERAGAVCWQKQLRDRYAAEGTPPVPHLDVGRAVVRPVSRKMAEQVILKYEWLGAMAQTSRHYGIFFGNHCAGVSCVNDDSRRANRNAHREFGLQDGEVAYLARGACVHWAPPGTNSKLVSWTCRLVAKVSRAKVMIAYADTDAGEIGTIYQACNWTYIGRGSSTKQWVSPGGVVRDQLHPFNLARREGGTRAGWVDRLRKSGWSEQASNPKHRYAYVLDKSDAALVARVARMRRPYPKRAGSVDSGTSANHAGGGGATPTPALCPVKTT
jgi:hypothetical protein